jgi:deoxyribodipyrimidine photo-lyase
LPCCSIFNYQPTKNMSKKRPTTTSSSKSKSKKKSKLNPNRAQIHIKIDPSKVDKSRVRHLSGPTTPSTAGECVLYWMSRDQRMNDNWALLYAQERAIELNLPFAVVFSVVPTFLQATIRQFKFMLRGLAEVEASLTAIGIPFFLLSGHPTQTIPTFVTQTKPALLVTDFSPLRVGREWKESVGALLPTVQMEEVDAHNVVPVWQASDKIEYAARTIRPKINKQLDRYLREFPSIVSPHPYAWNGVHPKELLSTASTASATSSSSSSSSSSKLQHNTCIDWEAVDRSLQVNRTVPEVTWIIPGETAARNGLNEFLTTRFQLYKKRNDPTINGCSNLSPWLHFGQISAQRCALEAKKMSSYDGGRDSFLEELIIRREVS